MNKMFATGNLTRDPELRTTKDGVSVCSFTIAVNNRKTKDAQGNPEVDYFKVVAWRQLGENCGKFLSKGSKVTAIGSLSLKNYKGNDGVDRYNMEITADDIEFLSSKAQRGDADDSGLTYTPPTPPQEQGGFTAVELDDGLPF